MLSSKQQAAGLRFAKAARRISWNGVMVTDSSYFRLHAQSGKQAGRWCRPENRDVVQFLKHSIAVHCYMGITCFGATSLMFVTGTHKQISQHINPKTKQPHSGVCSKEYSEVIAELFVPQGQDLFQHSPKWSGSWQLQQDNAKPHMTATNLELIDKLVPGKRFMKWPANSPDLSPVENVWAWMDQELRKRPQCHTVDELKATLSNIRDSIPPSTFSNLFKGMTRRMDIVIERGGGHIGK